MLKSFILTEIRLTVFKEQRLFYYYSFHLTKLFKRLAFLINLFNLKFA